MNAFVSNPSPNGRVREPPALDKAGGEAAPERLWIAGRELRMVMLDRQLERLGRLAEIAMGMAEELGQKAEAATKAGDAATLQGTALAFVRVSRAVRQINFQEQEILALREKAFAKLRETVNWAAEYAAKRHKNDGRDYVFDTVRELARTSDLGMDERTLDDIARDFRKDYDDYYDLYRGSFDEIILRICRDLGITEPAAPLAQLKAARADSSAAVHDDAQAPPIEAVRAHGRDPP